MTKPVCEKLNRKWDIKGGKKKTGMCMAGGGPKGLAPNKVSRKK